MKHRFPISTIAFTALAIGLVPGFVRHASGQDAAPPARGRGFGRGPRPKGPPGPVPRLPDGKPDLTGIWNGFGGSGQDAPDMLPWAAKIVAEHRAKNGAE